MVAGSKLTPEIRLLPRSVDIVGRLWGKDDIYNVEDILKMFYLKEHVDTNVRDDDLMGFYNNIS